MSSNTTEITRQRTIRAADTVHSPEATRKVADDCETIATASSSTTYTLVSAREAPQPPTTKHRYYKPFSTESSTLFMYLLSTLVFIAAIETILRRGIPIVPGTNADPADTSDSKNLSAIGLKMYGNSSWSSDEPPRSNYQPPAVLKCIGVERIVSVALFDLCEDTPCTPSTTSATYERPIYNSEISTMPCYSCAMKSQGLIADGWITASTTTCDSCTTTYKATVYPCASCEGTILTSQPAWQTVPPTVGREYTTFAPKSHSHENLHTSR